jgi:hypothetical protein
MKVAQNENNLDIICCSSAAVENIEREKYAKETCLIYCDIIREERERKNEKIKLLKRNIGGFLLKLEKDS